MPRTATARPRPVRLRDYRPPAFAIDTTDLLVELDPDATRIRARLQFRRLTAGPTPLVLAGRDLVLTGLSLDGEPLAADRFQVRPGQLTVQEPPERFLLEVSTRVNPAANTALEGLYTSGGLFCTQCEPEGFRRLTYFLDRPDVLSVFTTTIVADPERWPVLLANGNLAAAGSWPDGRSYARWHDPFPKPCYLFALVAGPLVAAEDAFVTASGRRVELKLYVRPEHLDRTDHALASLKKAMAWDERVFGREYDLDLYMIVAIDDFNMGAMENKGLNLFNAQYVLAKPETATDADFQSITAVIAHEYFHNWTGNRITCRDWFQLSLKEGLTIFRDQEFTADTVCRPVKRINDVRHLRTSQFPEDAGPLAHPVQPQSYIEINNFYTSTVYQKGAEVARMLRLVVGEAAFMAGMDLFFRRHDGQAVTIDDFLAAMAETSGQDLGQFRRWYTQAGTPEVRVEHTYDPRRRRLRLVLEQDCPPSPGQRRKAPFLIPVAVGLVGSQGQ
ncbi:MAG: aminopeptidase N, partial [Thermodesulfobacteriota bacterium]